MITSGLYDTTMRKIGETMRILGISMRKMGETMRILGVNYEDFGTCFAKYEKFRNNYEEFRIEYQKNIFIFVLNFS